ncbi:MAG: NTP transferase domain-containing protein [Methanosphaera sp.]|nr:NTP transferase domain-containing protein [Methanosphaera sp.]
MDAIITAAGKNSRMINDFKRMNKTPIHKLKLKIDNKEILIHTIDNILESDIDNIIIVLGNFRNQIYELLEDYGLTDKISIKYNKDNDVGLSQTITTALNGCEDRYYLFAAADQPTITANTINNMIEKLENSPKPDNTISILARRKTGWLDSAEGLGMPFCCYGNLLYGYLKGENDNLNPILRKMIKNNVAFYGVKAENNLELLNINCYSEYLKIKEEIERI